MQYTKIQPCRFLGSTEEDFLSGFLPYMGMTDILFNDAEWVEQIENTPLTESPMGNLVKVSQAVENWSSCFREEDI